MMISRRHRFWLLICSLMLTTSLCLLAGESPIADWVERFSNQIIRGVPAKPKRGVVILQRFENTSKETAEFLNEIFQSVTGFLQKGGVTVYPAASEEEARNIAQRLRDEETVLVQAVLSETLIRLDLSARISYPRRGGNATIALATLEKAQRTRPSASSAGDTRHVTLQEIYRSPALPFKILDVAVAELADRFLLLLLTEANLLGYRFENNNLVPDFKAAVPTESEDLLSRDPYGALAIYHYQGRDHMLVATHRTGGTYLLREDGGAWSFMKLSSDWLFKTRRPPAKTMALSARPAAGKNYFSGELGLLDFSRFAAALEDRIRDNHEGVSATLSLQSPFAVRHKIGAFYQLSFADQERSALPLIVYSGLDSRLHLYDTSSRETRVFRDPLAGAALTTYFDAERNLTYLFTTAAGPPQTTDALTVLELRDGELRPLTKTSNYPGAITALGVGHLTGRDGLNVIAVLENPIDFDTESVVYIFNLRG